MKTFGPKENLKQSVESETSLCQPSTSAGIKRKLSSDINKKSTLLEKKKSSEKCDSDKLVDKLPKNLLYVILNPFILNEKYESLNQPFLVKIQESQLKSFGFKLPFTKFMDLSENCFKIQLRTYDVYVSIIAIGDSPLEIGKSLKENVDRNQALNGMKKIKKYTDYVTELTHVPLDSADDLPPKQVFSSRILSYIFGNDSQTEKIDSNTSETKKQVKLENSKPCEDENNIGKDLDFPDYKAKVQEFEKPRIDSHRSELDLSITQILIKSVYEQLKDLDKMKSNLSDRDTTGSILLTVINLLSDFIKLVDHQTKKEDETAQSIPETDRTYKNSTKSLSQHQHHQSESESESPTISDLWSISSTTTTPTSSPLASLSTSALLIALNVSSLIVQGSSLLSHSSSSLSSLYSDGKTNDEKNIIIFSSSSKGLTSSSTNSPLLSHGNGSLLSSFQSNGSNLIVNCCNHNLTSNTNLPTNTIISTTEFNIDNDNSTSIVDYVGQGFGISTLSVFDFYDSPFNGQFNLTSVFDQDNLQTNWTNQSVVISSNLNTLFNDTIINSSYIISGSSLSPLNPNDIISANWTTEPDLRIHHPFLALLLGIICLLVMFGNILIMVAIRRERYLHTVTNLFVASLAVADCLVGAIVMPSSVVHEVMNKWWIFGQDWCDLWHSFDVLASTASILNLCVISLDRYWAITDPISYPARMTNRKAKILIALVWTCSALISFPAILWWRAVSSPPRPLRCDFTEDVGYLLFSSIISFYGPLIIMLVVYLRIYRAAIQQTKSVRSGTKSIAAIDGNENNAVVLRIHRGGGAGVSTGASVNPSSGPVVSSSSNCYCEIESHNHLHHHHHFNQSSQHHLHNNHQIKSPRLVGEVSFEESSDYLNSDDNGLSVKVSSVRHRNMKAFSLSRKLAKLAKEKKAAKTLGIVMGVFILCWLPFFIANLVKGFCGDYCLINPDLVYPLVTWLGWLNSGMNPVIYACWSRDFRRAFKKILCSCYKPKSNRGTKILNRPGGGTIGGTVQSTRYNNNNNNKSTMNKKSIRIKSNHKNDEDENTVTIGDCNENNNLESDNYSPVDVFKQYNQSVYNSNHNNSNNNNNKSPKCPNDSIGMIGLKSASSFKSTRKESTVNDIFFLTKK
ncbi:uncharacterized protein LOC128394010 [Panonychus citri]|uniref:uncharacterized protein LOC128394010 n=1 Tax=Panonychus citri TaxID=50023 RepID=UPI002306F298|nr:uncharacterized protein LOC128394010 [Panonychus citri]